MSGLCARFLNQTQFNVRNLKKACLLKMVMFLQRHVFPSTCGGLNISSCHGMFVPARLGFNVKMMRTARWKHETAWYLSGLEWLGSNKVWVVLYTLCCMYAKTVQRVLPNWGLLTVWPCALQKWSTLVILNAKHFWDEAVVQNSDGRTHACITGYNTADAPPFIHRVQPRSFMRLRVAKDSSEVARWKQVMWSRLTHLRSTVLEVSWKQFMVKTFAAAATQKTSRGTRAEICQKIKSCLCVLALRHFLTSTVLDYWRLCGAIHQTTHCIRFVKSWSNQSTT